MSKPLLKSEWEVLREQLKSEKNVLKALEEHYEEALKDIDSKIASMLGRNDANLPHVIRRIEYQKMIKAQIKAVLDALHAKEYETISEYLNEVYTDAFVGSVYTLHHQDMPVIVPIDQNAVVKAVTIDSKLKTDLYTSLGKDVNKLKKTVASEITRGIASGMLYDEISRNIKNASGVSLRRARTITRTEAGRVQEQATFDAAKEAKAAGADVVKQWSAIRDGKTRDTHRMLDGQVREVEEYFTVSGHKALHPHGFNVASEDINCRCTMLTRARSAMDEDELKIMQERAAAHRLLVKDKKGFDGAKVKDFYDFKKKYMKAAEEVAQEPSSTFVPAKNKADAEAFAKQAGIKYVDYSKLPLETVNALNEALATLPEDVKPVFVGDSNTLEKYWGGKLPRSSKNYYGVTVQTYSGIHLGAGNGFDFDTEGYMVAISSSYKTADKITAAKQKAQEAYQKKNGRKWFFNETGESTAFHEMGHVYANIKGLPSGFDKAAIRWAEESGCDMLKKPSEAWAEAWAAYHGKTNPLPDYISKYISDASGKTSAAKARAGLISFDDDGIISKKKSDFKQAFEDGKVRTVISSQKQARHVKGTKEFALYVDKMAVRGDRPSYIREDLNTNDLQELVISKLKGNVQITSGNGYREFVTCDETIGYYYSKPQGKYIATRCAQVNYATGNGNIHIIPVKELQGGELHESED